MNHPDKRRKRASTALHRLWVLGLSSLLLLILPLLTGVAPVTLPSIAQAQNAGRLAVVGAQGADLYDMPDGAVAESLTAGATLTAIGRTADRLWIVVQTDTNHTGWVETQRIVIFGVEQLPVMPAEPAESPIATQTADPTAVATTPLTRTTPVVATRAATPVPP